MLTLMVLLSVISSILSEKDKCDGEVLLNQYYDRKMLFGSIQKPINLLMHLPSGSLFFSHVVNKDSQIDFRIRVCRLKTGDCMDIKEVNGGHSTGYDPRDNSVYLGGRDGIYRYDYDTQTAEYVGEKDKLIWNMFIKEQFFYVEGTTKKLYVSKNNKFVELPETQNIEVISFLISRSDKVYLSNNSGIFKADKLGAPFKVLDSEIVANQIIQDPKTDDVLFATINGIYADKAVENTFRRIGFDFGINVPVFGMAYTERMMSKRKEKQLIYATKNSIFILVPSKNSAVCLRKKKISTFKSRRWRPFSSV